ncbi:MAG: bifunctional 2-keto-4-hydroxyglutarate aldolase/2-keto-3-deoxy-6-phosphogluconate aldolase [Acidobacteria bacterium]|nr:bifunctional 2-keto-4-hydroxyglutarate aldolase/2-keto-3-deoxy-6-phosphogluconate aldolase [Acidobacteriota bacterium]MBK8148116.1 bifunctional 2-keto-4-hydroxyglutarate aldolase/2-keto-3-deoxy-6-phosphogluconate aldolase [Acidobacteriota bacterium]MBK8811864.1 bifunctional 2-keto-4-hydroxyglutarate aldolase/2-keto-3-deoxy-6-phosphogluconate aldolase [Acidobacteriota bacterium]
MKSSEVVRRIIEIGVVPVVRANSPEEALAAVDAIKAGGVPILEITMTVPGAVKVIERIADMFGDEVVLGAGTVLDPETARACILAGATFIVSPALNLATIELCKRYSVPICPGALTPTEVVTAWQAGADFVKVFPCSAMGGASYIKGLKAPLPQVELIPTGGVNLNTAADFIKAGSSALGIGADLVDLKAIRNGEAHIVTERAVQFAQIVKDARTG